MIWASELAFRDGVEAVVATALCRRYDAYSGKVRSVSSVQEGLPFFLRGAPKTATERRRYNCRQGGSGRTSRA